jgi:hypothetical protein
MVLTERWASHAIATLPSQGEAGNFSRPEVRFEDIGLSSPRTPFLIPSEKSSR